MEENLPVLPEDEKKLVEEIAILKAKGEEEGKKWEEEKTGLVAQLKELRERAQVAELRKVEKPDEKPNPDADETEKKVRAILSEDKKAKAETAKEKALREFWEKHPEFNPANDIAGLKGQVLAAALKRINAQSSETEEDFKKDFEDALVLLKRPEIKPNKPMENNLPPVVSPKEPGAEENTPLTAEEEKLRKEKGWTIEKFVKMKAKYPAFFR